MSAPARFDAYASVAQDSIDLPDFKTRYFRFADFGTVAYDGSPGWNYTNAVLTLRYAKDPHAVLLATFVAHLTVTSVGRQTSNDPWHVHAELKSDDQTLRDLIVGDHRVYRGTNELGFAGGITVNSLPSVNGGVLGDMTLDEFNSINKIHLYAVGRQDSL